MRESALDAHHWHMEQPATNFNLDFGIFLGAGCGSAVVWREQFDMLISPTAISLL